MADRYRLPRPRLALGTALVGIAHAAMDISDGLVQDLGHLCRAGGLAAELCAADLPLSPAARAADRLALCLTGGDDYELLFAVPPAHEHRLAEASRATGIAVTRIGTFRDGPARVTVLDRDRHVMTLPNGGWSHFA